MTWFRKLRTRFAFAQGGVVAAAPIREEDMLVQASPPGPLPTWRCFHCDQVLFTEHAARQHFGPCDGATPACQIKAAEGGLLRALREAEDEAARAWDVVHSEGADGLQAWRGALSRHDQAVRSAEEAGYERGLRDQQRSVDTLRRLLVWHGDPVRLARTREDWQQEVDEAMRFVRDHPEEGYPARPTVWQHAMDPRPRPDHYTSPRLEVGE